MPSTKYSVAACLGLLGLTVSIASAKYGGGDGGSGNPYQIRTAAQMNEIGLHQEDWGSCFILINNINMSGYTGTQYNVIGYRNSSTDYLYFTGTFNGNGKTIRNFSYRNLTNKMAVGLFGAVGTAHILNLTLTDLNVDGYGGSAIGGLVGYQAEGSITNCHVTGAVKGNLVTGGLIGASYAAVSQCSSSVTVTAYANNSLIGGLIGLSRGILNQCSSAGAVTGGYSSKNMGGLVGALLDATVSNCFSTASVTAGEKGLHVGGLAGYQTNGSVIDCYATGIVSAGITSEAVGGLIGLFQGTAVLERCYSTGDVAAGTSSSYVGGLIGDYFAGDVTSSFSTGDVSCPSAIGLGGLAGMHCSGTIWHCYCTGNVTGYNPCTYVGGFTGGSTGAIFCSYSVGTVSTDPAGEFIGGFCGGFGFDVVRCFWNSQTTEMAYSGGGKPRTTAQMRQANNYANWNTATQTNWVIDEGVDYPHLAWETAGGTNLPAAAITACLQGQGTLAEPFIIHDANELNLLGVFYDEWDKHYRLAADIDLCAIGGAEFNMIGAESVPFSGSFEGNGYAIHHFTYITGHESRVGLFKVLSGSVHNLRLNDMVMSIQSGVNIGGLAGLATASSAISGCRVQGEISIAGVGDGVGGLIGKSEGSINYSNSDIRIVTGEASKFAGGLVGSIYGDISITQCSSKALISAGAKSNYIGGLFGSGSNPLVQCFTTGAIIAGNNCWYIGGLVGEYNSRTPNVRHCYSKVSLTCGSSCQKVGGLTGYLHGGADIYYSYSMGHVTCGALSTQVGGLVGTSGSGSYAYYSYWDKQTSGQNTSATGTGRDTAQMLLESSYSWDFINTWRICDGTNYPRLQWEPLPVGDFVCPEGVELADVLFMADQWLLTGPSEADIAPAVVDGKVNLQDFALLTAHWLEGVD